MQMCITATLEVRYIAQAQVAIRQCRMEMLTSRDSSCNGDKLLKAIARFFDWCNDDLSRRCLRIALNVPVVVQNAVMAGRLTLVDAEIFLSLGSSAQDKIVSRIQAGKTPRAVMDSAIDDHRSVRSRRHKSRQTAPPPAKTAKGENRSPETGSRRQPRP